MNAKVLEDFIVDTLSVGSSRSNTDWPFGGPLVLTISVPKGGDNKTWVAFNLASILGIWGYDVAVVDSNAQHDLWSDVQFLAGRGITPRFDVVLHDPLDADGNQTPLSGIPRNTCSYAPANGHGSIATP
jgi:hypothetical protein